MDRFITEQIRGDQLDHRRASPTVLPKIEDQGFSVLQEGHCGRNRFGPGLMVIESAKVDIPDVAVHALYALEPVVDTPIEPAALLDLISRRLAAVLSIRKLYE